MDINTKNFIAEKRGRKLYDFGLGPVAWKDISAVVIRRSGRVTIRISGEDAIRGNWLGNSLEVTEMRDDMQLRYGTDELEGLSIWVEDLIRQLDLLHDGTLSRGESN